MARWRENVRITFCSCDRAGESNESQLKFLFQRSNGVIRIAEVSSALVHTSNIGDKFLRAVAAWKGCTAVRELLSRQQETTNRVFDHKNNKPAPHRCTERLVVMALRATGILIPWSKFNRNTAHTAHPITNKSVEFFVIFLFRQHLSTRIDDCSGIGIADYIDTKLCTCFPANIACFTVSLEQVNKNNTNKMLEGRDCSPFVRVYSR